MQLSRRLQAVAELVTPGMRVADVGCDHAYTAIYLAEHEISPHIIAMDVNQGPVDRAKENINKFGFADRIEVRKSDGLLKLKQGEVDTILIAGMGGQLTTQILSARMDIVKEVRELILQPQSEIYKVRQLLQEEHFLIIKENMIKEDGKYYTMMKAVPETSIQEEQPYLLTEREHFYYGRLLLEQKHPVLSEFLIWNLSLCEGIVNSLQAERTENAMQSEKEIREKMLLIKRGLGYFDEN